MKFDDVSMPDDNFFSMSGFSAAGKTILLTRRGSEGIVIPG